MNLALIVHSTVLMPALNLVRWLASSTHAPRPTASPATSSYPTQFVQGKGSMVDTGQLTTAPIKRLPLRVVSVFEAGQARCAVGRMRISGRMADVCAELDRLAARESLTQF